MAASPQTVSSKVRPDAELVAATAGVKGQRVDEGTCFFPPQVVTHFPNEFAIEGGGFKLAKPLLIKL